MIVFFSRACPVPIYFIFSEPRLTTQELSGNITDLQPCESYLFSVGIVGPKGPGPLSREPIELRTEQNDKKPPRNVRISIDHDSREMTIIWEHNCPFIDVTPKYPTYIVNVTEITYNKSAVVELKSRDKVMMHKFEPIEDGSVFDVSISSSSKGAVPYVRRVYAAPLPPPRQLKVWPEKNGTYIVYWKDITLRDPK